MKNLTEYVSKFHLYAKVSLKIFPVFSEALHHEMMWEGGRTVALSTLAGS